MRFVGLCLGVLSCSGPTDDGTLDEPTGQTGDSGSAVDADNDGFDSLVDCDDSDPDIHPDALEVCDGVDNDCDTYVDDQAAATVDEVNYATLQDALDAAAKLTEATVAICPQKAEHVIQSVQVPTGNTLALVGVGGAELTVIIDTDAGAMFQVDSGGRLVLEGVTADPSQDSSIEIDGAGHAVVRDSLLIAGPSTVVVDNVVSKSPATLLVERSEIRGVQYIVGRGVSLSGLFQATLRDTTISENDGNNSNGAGIHASGLNPGASTLELDTVIVSGNSGNDGGGLFASGVVVTAQDSVFSSNEAVQRGGALVLERGATFDGGGTTVFTLNEARDGGAIYVDDGALSGVTIEQANSAWRGGGLAVDRRDLKDPLTLSNVVIRGGNLGNEGGGIYVGPQTEVILDKTCAVHGNEALKSDGGGVFLAGVGAVLESQGATWSDGKSANTPADVAFNGGGSVTFSSATPQVRCTFADGACNPL